jgi:hypothetical protein
MAVGEAFVEIGVDFAQLRRSLNKAKGEFATSVKRIEGNADRAGRSIGKSLGGGLKKGLAAVTAGFAALLVSGGMVINTLIKSQRESLKLQKALRATSNASGFTAKQLEKHAEKLQDATTFDDTDIKRSMALISSFTNITGENFKKTAKAALDMSALFGGDLKDTTITLAKALSDPIRGLTSLRRNGVLFTRDQEKLIKAMAETGDIAAAQNEIFNILKINGIDGNADATAALADQWSQFQNIFEDVLVDIGTGIASMFGLTGKTTTLTDKMKELRGEVRKFKDDGTFKAIGAVLIPVLKKVARFIVVISHGIAQLLLIPKAMTSFGKEAKAVDDKIIKLEKSTKKLLDLIDNADADTQIKKTGDAAFDAARKAARAKDDLILAKKREVDAEKERAKALARVQALQKKKKDEAIAEAKKIALKRQLARETKKLDKMEKRLAETIANRAKAEKAEKAAAESLRKALEVPKKALAAQEQELANLERARDAISDIASIQTVGVEDLFSAISSSALENMKKGLVDAADLGIEAQRQKITKTKDRISDIETKSREDAIKKAALDQIKNQEEQITLQKQTIKAIQQQKGGSVFSNE